MQQRDIADEIRDFISADFLFGQPFSLRSDASLLENGIIDSTGVLELVAFLEERYAITVEDHDVTPDNLDSVLNISAYVSGKLGCEA